MSIRIIRKENPVTNRSLIINKCHFVSDEMTVDLNMLGSLMISRIRCHLDCRHIVTVDERRAWRWAAKVKKELAKPISLCNSMSTSTVFSLSTGLRSASLSLR